MSANYYCKFCGESFGNDKENPRIINWCSTCCSDERQINERGYKNVTNKSRNASPTTQQDKGH